MFITVVFLKRLKYTNSYSVIFQVVTNLQAFQVKDSFDKVISFITLEVKENFQVPTFDLLH